MTKHFLVIVVIACLFLGICCKKEPCITCSTPPEDTTSHNQWTKVESGVTNWLNDVDFPDDQNGWIVGDKGLILNSKNGGETWQRQTCPRETFLSVVDFTDNKNGWICSRDSILRTTNGGESWAVKYSEDLGAGRFRDVQFLNKNIGFVVGGKGDFGSVGFLLKTEEGGETWQQASLNNLPTLTHISIVDEQNIWVCGFNGTILLSTDIGLTWTNKNFNISPAPYLTTIQFVDQYHGWASSSNDIFGFYRTTDGGNTWIQRSKGDSMPEEDSLCYLLEVQTFFFSDSLNGWLSTFMGGRLAKTIDGGLKWEYLPEDKAIVRIYSFYFRNKNLGWAVGLKASNSNAVGVILLYRNTK